MADVSRKSGLLNYETYKRKGERASAEDVNRALNNDFGPLGYDAQDMLARAAYKDANKDAAAELKREASRAETMKTVNKKKGGAVKARGCGVAKRGLTKGKMR